MSSIPPVTASAHEDLKMRLENMRGDKDRVRLIKAASNGTQSFTCAQVVELISCQAYGASIVETAAIMYNTKSIADVENFGDILASLKFQEDRDDVKAKTGYQ